jgi:hypothetical protein
MPEIYPERKAKLKFYEPAPAGEINHLQAQIVSLKLN